MYRKVLRHFVGGSSRCLFIAALALTSTLANTSVARADTSWDCFRKSDGRYTQRVTIWWGHTARDATWACNEWVSNCGASGGCVASGNPGNSSQCDVRNRRDGCSIPLSDPTSLAYKEIFRLACNAHDACYHAPWNRISDYWSGFNKCNDNFWIDMNRICDRQSDFIGCRIVASVWADAMNFDPLRTQFSNAFGSDQRWTNQNCSY